jgi:hypothetical protein
VAYIYARHEIESYERWERAHEANAETRAAHGSLGSVVYRPTRDPGAETETETETILVVIKVAEDRLEEMLAYSRSTELRETMDAAGVVEIRDSAVVEKVHEMDA